MAEVWGSTGRQSKRERSNTEDGKKWFGFIVHIITDTALQRVTSRLDRSFGFELLGLARYSERGSYGATSS